MTSNSNGFGQWTEFQQLYDAGKWDEAIQWLRSHPPKDPDVSASYFHNLGTTLIRSGQYGLATAYLEKAAQIDPSNEAVEKNLEFARAKLSALIGESRLDPAASWVDLWAPRLPVYEISAAFSLLLLLGLVSVAGRYRRLRQAKAAWFSRGGALIFLSLLSLSLLGAVGAGLLSSPAATSLESEIVRSGPGERFLEIGRVETGMKLRTTGRVLPDEKDATKNWLQIRFSPGQVGWLKASGLLLL